MDDAQNIKNITESGEAAVTVDTSATDTTDTKTSTTRLIKDGDISKNIVDLIKYLPDILEKCHMFPQNLTINNISGDSYSGNAVNDSAGHDNIFEQAVSFHSESKCENSVCENKKSEVDLSDYKAVYEYLKTQQCNPYCSLVISLSIFDNSQYDLVCEEARLLYEMLVDETYIVTTSEGEKTKVHRDAFEISRQEATSIFGIRFYQDTLITFGGRIETDFIGFSSNEHACNILRCVFKEFLVLKDKITGFLTRLICSEKIILYAAAINALKNLCDINPEYFISKIVVRLLKEKSIPSDIAVAQMLCSIAENSKNIYSADKYLNFISKVDKDIHYYIITLMMCKTLAYNRKKIGKLIHPIIQELISQPGLQLLLNSMKMDLPVEDDFINNVDLFFNIGNRYAEYYIALVSELYEFLSNMKRNDGRRDLICFVTLLFIKEDYNESCLSTNDEKKFVDMIFIRLILRLKDNTANKLVYLWSEILRNKKFKVIGERYLAGYLSQRNRVAISDTEYRKIKFFFLKLAETDTVKGKTQFFLKRLYTHPRNRIDLAGKILYDMGGLV